MGSRSRGHKVKRSRGWGWLVAITGLVLLSGCSGAGTDVPKFDGQRAYELLEKQCAFGPRVPGSPGHDEAAAMIRSILNKTADGVAEDEFTATVNSKSIPMRNITGYFKGKTDRWVLLAAHWDTRPTADIEVTAEKRKLPIPGANDGASGVAVLIELARVFHEKKPGVGVFMVFFDGEDYGPGEKQMYLGAKRFAANLDRQAAVNGKPIKIEYGILLDMVGDKNLRIYQERNSLDAAPKIVEKVWRAAEELGYRDKFVSEAKYSISDDHLPLIRAGVKCIDIIDFDYAYWHTLDDTPDKCSPESLRVVGETVARVVYSEPAE